jgi:hypothetical protein
MKTIQFNAVVGVDQVIRPPAGVALPEGEIEVTVRLRPNPVANVEDRLLELCARRGLSPSNLTDEIRARLFEELACEDRGVPPPRPGEGALKGSIVYMAPDFDAPLEDMKEYME